MSGSVADRKRLLHVSADDCRVGRLDVAAHLDFFPGGKGSAGRHKQSAPRGFKLELQGFDEPVQASVAAEPGAGGAVGLVLEQPSMRDFMQRHQIRSGDVLAIERIGTRTYRLYPFETQRLRSDDWRGLIDAPSKGGGPLVLELFAGCGGLALGFKRAGFRTALCNEWDASACDSIRKNVTTRVAQCAIQEIDRFPSADVVAGGPPCQGFSNLGERVPNDPRNQLWRHYVRAVLDARPKVFVLENVPPLLASQEYVELVGMLGREGYVIEGRVLNSADYGVPQTRKRAIVIGVLNGAPSFPTQTHVDPRRRNLLTAELKPWVTVRDAIGDLPLEPNEKNWHIGRNPTEMSLRRYRCVPPGGNRWDLPPDLTPECWKRKTKGGTDLFGRLWWDRPSVTIRCEFYKPEKGRYLHPVAHRPITHREAARLQSFPDDFDFQGKRIDVGVQIGNAVPPVLAEAIARHVMKTYFDDAKTEVRKRRDRRSVVVS
jgi:DNA (cytosine-5)-methyltransferase 1